MNSIGQITVLPFHATDSFVIFVHLTWTFLAIFWAHWFKGLFLFWLNDPVSFDNFCVREPIMAVRDDGAITSTTRSAVSRSISDIW